jgi:hypothetical protein
MVIVFGGGKGKVWLFMHVEQDEIGWMRTLRGFFKESGNTVFPMGAQRGNPGTDDWYHMVFVRLRYPIFDRAVDVGYPRFFYRKDRWPYSNF